MSSLVRDWWLLGLVSFGGPGSHLGLFERKFVGTLRLSSRKFSEYLAMCSALPGATSTQLATCLGIQEKGSLGGVLAFILFSLPGLLLMLFGGLVAVSDTSELVSASSMAIVKRWIDCGSLSIVTVAAVALTKKTCNHQLFAYVLALGTALIAFRPQRSPFLYPVLCFGCGVLSELSHRVLSSGRRRSQMLVPLLEENGVVAAEQSVSTRVSLVCLVGILLIGITSASQPLLRDMFATGIFVFGGGAVAIPFLHNAVVGAGLMSLSQFLSALSLVYCAPGPMFNLSMYLGIVCSGGSVVMGSLCWVCMVLPGFLLVLAVFPVWKSLRAKIDAHAPLFMDGLNAGACGLLLAAAVALWRSSHVNFMQCLVVLAGLVGEIFGRLAPHWILVGCLVLGLADWELLSVTGVDLLA